MKHPRIIIRWFVACERFSRFFTDEHAAHLRAEALNVLGIEFEVIRL